MKNKIIIISVLVLVIAISGCVNSDMEGINQIIPKLNDNIKNGDLNFNLAVDGLNSYNRETAKIKVRLAIENFNNAKINIGDIQRAYKNLNNTNYIDYIDLISNELESKINASLSLQSAAQTQYNNYIDSANAYMKTGVYYQHRRDSLVRNNPNLFN
ncbi:MAG: hypothetical protein LBT66_01035 [Methanobrevibacter sp.]|nr:hypothetical protein [Candidatus Methanovirga meridionalis]